MVQSATLQTVYRELQSLKKELEVVKYALIPEEKVSAKELKDLKRIADEMESGREKSFDEVFND